MWILTFLSAAHYTWCNILQMILVKFIVTVCIKHSWCQRAKDKQCRFATIAQLRIGFSHSLHHGVKIFRILFEATIRSSVTVLECQHATLLWVVKAFPNFWCCLESDFVKLQPNNCIIYVILQMKNSKGTLTVSVGMFCFAMSILFNAVFTRT